MIGTFSIILIHIFLFLFKVMHRSCRGDVRLGLLDSRNFCPFSFHRIRNCFASESVVCTLRCMI